MLGINDINQLQKTIDSKNGTISVLKSIVRKWVYEHNILDQIIDLKDGKIFELLNKLHQINKLAKEHDYWSSNLQKATEIINKIAELSEVK